MALNPQLLEQLGIKRDSELEAPDGPPAELPWNEETAQRPQRKRAEGERSDRSVLKQHRENRIASGSLRVPATRPRRDDDPDQAKPEGGRAAGKGSRRSAGAGAGARAGQAGHSTANGSGQVNEAFQVPAAPDWADQGAPPAWAVEGDVPERVATILDDWDRKEAEAAELIAAGIEVLPGEQQAQAREVIELTPDEAQQLARAVCLRLLTAMPRTRHELEQKLRDRDVPDAAACVVLDRYEELGIINDAAFAAAWVESRSRSKGFARGRLKQELKRKGVDGPDLEAALEQIDGDEERERAEALALKKLGSRCLPPAGYGTPDAAERDKILRRVIGFLARKGYPGGVAMSAARKAMERHDAGER